MKELIKIDEVRLSRLNNAEYTNFMSRTRDEVAIATVEKIGVTAQEFALLDENIGKMEDLVAQSRVSDITAKLAELDNERDNIIIYIMAEIANKCRSPLANIKDAATSLYNATKQYVGIQESPEQQESQQINGLLLDLAKSDNKVTLLGLDGVIVELKRINEEFIALTAERTHEKVANTVENSKSVRVACDKVYNYIATMAFITSVATPSAEATTFITNMNALIKETMTRYKQRSSTKNKSDEIISE